MSEQRNTKKINVVAAVIYSNGNFFVTQRGYGEFQGYWEFPGGKVEKGESKEDALKREIKEELSTKIEIVRHIQTIDYDYPTFHITLNFYLCRVEEGLLTLNEHESAKWLKHFELTDLNWLPADREFVEMLSRNFNDL
jgi:8-oxo-dGTP diphosphatase